MFTKKFRLVIKDNKVYIQKRGWLFFWDNLYIETKRAPVMDYNHADYELAVFNTVAGAKRFLEINYDDYELVEIIEKLA